jgi:tetratricopeptide (TPR) repeat protein
LAAVGCDRADPVGSGATSGFHGGDASDFDQEAALKDADAFAARAYERLGERKYDMALADYDQAIELKPDYSPFWNGRGFAWHMKGIGAADRSVCEDHAMSDYAEAIRLDPENASAVNNRAWIRATSTVDAYRNGELAVEEATAACELTAWKNPGYMDTLSVAYAELGDFDQAARWQQKAMEDPWYELEEGKNARAKLALFGKRQPFRE